MVAMTKYALSPLAKISRLDRENRAVLRAGVGDDRGHYALDGAAARPLIEWLLRCSSALDKAGLEESLRESVGLDSDDARELVENMIGMKVLVASDDYAWQHDHLTRWGRLGWRDAADFHLATFGLRFVPDQVDGITYAEHFGNMLEDTESVGQQPAAYTPRNGRPLPLSVSGATGGPALADVLAVAEPVNRFEGRAVRGEELLPPLRKAFGVQRTVGGLLGEHHFRSYPSGGARHPFEIYLVSKGIDGVPTGVYHFDSRSGDLIAIPDRGDAHDIDAACFGKGGIRSADAVLVLTCRWLRHSWKYRYARSYRMLLLEAGHIVQAVTLAMIRHGLNVYHCPSIDDRLVGQVLALGDDCAEGPLYALGLGHGGVR